MTSYTDPMACSPLASPSLNDAGADMWPSFSIEGETSYLSSSMTSLYSPSGTDVRANSRHPILRLNTTSLRPPASAPRISPSTGFFNILRAREQPLRMGIARRLSYNLHTPSPPTPPMGGGDSDMPLASPFIITSLRPHPPSSPIPTRLEQRPLGTPTPLRSPADGSNYFSVV
ncbi:hypothetical protein SCP_0704560 [Sparassis crispa]|uniref:Uncharacterized protein n=1 Tax=Sparassis crispa TaxID=139825 RepID=A0A401GSX7_9APHY|nr:hypothetical protein SCP_0704560 [Sparassis crispa]GBE85269.1 hypothetical protein SCP_0704560 [Sparassis crispa]